MTARSAELPLPDNTIYDLNARRVRVLKLARKRIETGKDMFLCQALAAIGATGERHRFPASLLRRRITKALDGCYTVERWLFKQGVPSVALTIPNMRIYRLRWIDALIKEYSQS